MTSLGEKPITEGEHSLLTVTSRGRTVQQQDYRKLAGMEDEVVSRKSEKSNKTVKSSTKSARGKNKKSKENVTCTSEVDSRAGDFDDEVNSEASVLSVGSDAGRLKKLEKELEVNNVTFGEKYNEYKVDQGLQVRLEDTEMPEDLESEIVYEECKTQNAQQLTASKDREARAERTLEILNIREEIISARERSKKLEWEVEIKKKKAELQLNQMILDQKRQRQEMAQLLEMERQQMNEFQILTEREKTPQNGGNLLKNLNSVTIGLNDNMVIDDTIGVNARVADWVSSHSQGSVAPQVLSTTQTLHNRPHISLNMGNANIIQQKAMRMIERKKKSRVEETAGRNALGFASEKIVSTCPLQGIDHLKKLELVPEGFGVNTQAEEHSVDMQSMQRKSKLTDPLLLQPEFNMALDDKNKECGCNSVKANIKSSKYAKSNLNIKRQEIWPHTAVSKRYTKRTNFDSLDFESFVAGESKIIYSMFGMEDINNALGRLRVLTLVAHWLCKNRHWPTVRTQYEAIIEEIELGEKEWTDDFSSNEMMLLVQTGEGHQGVVVGEKTKKTNEVYWCKLFQVGGCDKSSPHMAQLKPDDMPVPVVHMCAFCWINNKKKMDHGEAECAAKKG